MSWRLRVESLKLLRRWGVRDGGGRGGMKRSARALQFEARRSASRFSLHFQAPMRSNPRDTSKHQSGVQPTHVNNTFQHSQRVTTRLAWQLIHCAMLQHHERVYWHPSLSFTVLHPFALQMLSKVVETHLRSGPNFAQGRPSTAFRRPRQRMCLSDYICDSIASLCT